MVEKDTWTALKQLARGSKDIVYVSVVAEKLAKKAYPGQKNIATRQVIEAFIHVLEPKLPLELQKLGYLMLDDITAAAHRVERLQKKIPVS